MMKKYFLSLLIFLLSLQGFSQERIWGGVQEAIGLGKKPEFFSLGGFVESENLLSESNVFYQYFNNNKPSVDGFNLLVGYKCLNTKYVSFVFKGGYFLAEEGNKFINGVWLEPHLEFKIPNKKVSFFINTSQLFSVEKEITKDNPRAGVFSIGMKLHFKDLKKSKKQK